MLSKDFIVALNYASKYGLYNPKDDEMKVKAYKEFGKIAEDKLRETNQAFLIPNGLNGVWWDEVKQFVEKGIINWEKIEKNLVNNL